MVRYLDVRLILLVSIIVGTIVLLVTGNFTSIIGVYLGPVILVILLIQKRRIS